jgi:hypothetical protein
MTGTANPAAASVHPVVGFTRAFGAALDRVLVHDPAFLHPEDTQLVLVELASQHAAGRTGVEDAGRGGP